MEEQARRVSELLKVLANEHRLLILCALVDGPMTVTELSAHAPGITQSALSQHLALLRAHGILRGEKAGMNVVYQISDLRVNKVLAVLKEEYCGEHGDDV